MSSKRIRITLRYMHLMEGALIAAFIYSPFLRASEPVTLFIQLVIVPLTIFSGIALWQLPRFNKWRNGRRRSTVAR